MKINKKQNTALNLRLRSRQWIEDGEGNILIGEGRARILEIIDRTGSINKTAKELGMSYRGVWGKLRSTEHAIGFKFVSSEGRSGSRLTVEGRNFLARYLEMKKQCTEFEDRLFDEFFREYRSRDEKQS